jgi:hypothetical protein
MYASSSCVSLSGQAMHDVHGLTLSAIVLIPPTGSGRSPRELQPSALVIAGGIRSKGRIGRNRRI